MLILLKLLFILLKKIDIILDRDPDKAVVFNNISLIHCLELRVFN